MKELIVSFCICHSNYSLEKCSTVLMTADFAHSMSDMSRGRMRTSLAPFALHLSATSFSLPSLLATRDSFLQVTTAPKKHYKGPIKQPIIFYRSFIGRLQSFIGNLQAFSRTYKFTGWAIKSYSLTYKFYRLTYIFCM